MELNEMQLEEYTSIETSRNSKGEYQDVVKVKYKSTEKAMEELKKADEMLKQFYWAAGYTRSGTATPKIEKK